MFVNKMSPSGNVPLSLPLISFSGSPLSFSWYPRSLATIQPKSSAPWSPPAAFQLLRGDSVASLMTSISCLDTVCAARTGNLPWTGQNIHKSQAVRQAMRQFGDFPYTYQEGLITVQMNLDLNQFRQRSIDTTEGKFSH